ncbi:MAG: Unknown protein, partial [uncultured Sulfurovum sp.]
MKKIFLSILSLSIVFLFLTGCKDNNAPTSEQKSNKSSVFISIKKAEDTKVFSKQSLSINYMQVEVFDTLNNSDESYVDESYIDKTPINIKAFTKVASEWTVSLNNLQRNKYYIFVVTAFSSNDADVSKLIFKGIKTHEIVEGINTLEINLSQTANADTIENLPSASSIVTTTLVNGSIELSFNISNPYEEALNWEIRNDGVSTISDNFSSNSGVTSTLNTAIKLNYLETSSNSYLLLLSTEDATVSYHFSIDIDDNDEVDITVEKAPVITKLIVSVLGNELSLTPELDTVADAYAWEIVENLGSAINIDDTTAQNITLSPYSETSEFKIKLTVTATSGAFSYRIYHVFGNYSSDENNNVVIPPISTESLNIKKTQQTTSYDYLGDIDATVKDDGFYEKGLTPSYAKDSSTKIVTDNVTTLMWQDDNDTTLDWSRADQYCTDSSIGGFNDWRLPSMSELDSLKTYYPLDPVSSSHDVLIDGIFEVRSSFKYWSSFQYQAYQNTDRAWYVDFRMGNQGDGNVNRSGTYRVRCVRGTLTKPTFTKDIAQGIVTDSLNNLEWQDNGAFVAETWKEAMERCESLSLGEVGKDGGWRLPNVNELMSIVNRQ